MAGAIITEQHAAEDQEERYTGPLPEGLFPPSDQQTPAPTEPKGEELERPAEREPAETVPRRGHVPTRAVQAERERVREWRSRYEDVEAKRRAAEAELARARQEQAWQAQRERERQAERELAQAENDPDLPTALRRVRRVFQAEFDARDQARRQEIETLRQELTADRVYKSENEMRREHSDYDEVLARSGVSAKIALGPNGPADPFLHRMIFSHPEPARAAYEYAKGLLSEEVESEAEVRGERRARREVIDTITRGAERPRGVGNLRGASTSQSGLTREDIARLDDDQKRRLKRENPAAWDWYLGGGA